MIPCRTITFLCAALAACLALPGASLATFPGENGRILNSSPSSVLPDGTGELSAADYGVADGYYQTSIAPDGITVSAEKELKSTGFAGTVTYNLNGSYTDVGPGYTGLRYAAWTPEYSLIGVDGTGGLVEKARGTTESLRLTAGFDHWPAVSPDGTRVAFVRGPWGEGDIWAMNRDGSGQTNLTNTPDIDERKPDYAPDGTRLVYDSAPAGLNFDQRARTGEIWMMSSDGSSRRRLLAPAPGHGLGLPVFSPDNTKIAFLDAFGKGLHYKPELWTSDPDGANPTRLRKGGAPVAWGRRPEDSTPPETGARLKKRGKQLILEPLGEESSRFRCRIDDRHWRFECESDTTFLRYFEPGRHVWQVQAIDESGNFDPTPAKKAFRVPKRLGRKR